VRWEERRWPELGDDRGGVAILPLGAVEAHGPHLPLGTDCVIAEAMARDGARRLAGAGLLAFVLPTVAYAPAPFAREFPGTLSIRPATLTALLLDLAEALAARGVDVLALANAHFDPAQVAALRDVAARVAERGRPRLAFPDLTRRELAHGLGEEFRSGACHAGRYETSIVLAERPDLVIEAERLRLPALPVSLSAAARAGRNGFREAGLADAYCGDPAAASAAEGHDLIARLGEILARAVQAALVPPGASPRPEENRS
jgi:creatinine amidohydrolase